MSVNPLRYRYLNNSPYTGGAVVYHMCRDIRAEDNEALLYAQELAEEHQAELIVVYTIWNYLWEGSTRRFYDWVLPSLAEAETILRKHDIPLVVHVAKSLNDVYVPSGTGVLVIDQLPLHFMGIWKKSFLQKHTTLPLVEVDAHNVIPVWEASPKQEFAARTIRGKIHQRLPEYLESFSSLRKHIHNTEVLKRYKCIEWEDISKCIVCREDVFGVGSYHPGEVAAHKKLKDFFANKLTSYEADRNDFNKAGQSGLSPYLSHGNISRRRIMLELMKHTGVPAQEMFDAQKNGSNQTSGSVASFVEECVVRAELAENFCFYNISYDRVAGFPAWAQETLHKARTDAREYVYDQKIFEQALTHDELWNAAQKEMVTTGKMHGYLRMYWAKKILEWTSSPEEALRIAIYLNDTYELDGRDPNGYVGCAWSIGGVHDRPWFARPVFGTIRFMAQSGAQKRASIQTYIDRWLSPSQKLL